MNKLLILITLLMMGCVNNNRGECAGGIVIIYEDLGHREVLLGPDLSPIKCEINK